jgi:glyoxylase-like metal-dependent hydrolase (beta-lactamase superfamily II)
MLRKMMCFLVVSVFLLAASGLAQAVEVKAHFFNGGILKTQTQYMLKDTRIGTPMDIPIPFILIQHGKDWVAFDTGNNAQVAVDPMPYWTKNIVEAYTPVMKPDQEFKIQIKKLGLKPSDLKAVFLSHGHLDHAGAIDNFAGTDVPLYFQKAEMDTIRPILAAKKAGTAYILGDFARINELNIKEITGVYDVFGDKTVIVFPTPGHTPGHMSLFVKSSKGTFIYCADAMYTIENMDKMIGPGLAWDIPQSLISLGWFKLESMQGGVKIIPSHDPVYWDKKGFSEKKVFVPGERNRR